MGNEKPRSSENPAKAGPRSNPDGPDDELSFASREQAVLNNADHTRRRLASTVGALQAARRLGRFDMLLTDLMMPQMNGD